MAAMEFFAADAWSLLVPTILLISRLFLWDFRREVPFMLDTLLTAAQRRSPVTCPHTEAKLNRRLQVGRQRTFKAAATAWTIAADFYFAVLYVTKDEATTLLAWLTTPHILLGFLSWIVMRYCARPSVNFTANFLDFFLVCLLMTTVLSGHTLPQEMLPCLSCCRMMTSIFFLAPSQALYFNLVISPVGVLLHMRSQPDRFDWSSLLLTFTNESLILLFIVISSCYFKVSLREKVLNAMKMEVKTTEAEANLAAAKKLLNVTCDASIQLTQNLEIIKPDRAFLDILGAEEVEGRSFLEFISPTDQSRFLDVIKLPSKTRLVEPLVESPAGSLSVNLVTSDLQPCEVRLYHVAIPTSTFAPEGDETLTTHLLGATQLTAARAKEATRETEQDMRFLLGKGHQGPQTITQSVEDLVTVTTTEQLSGLEDIRLTLDAMSGEEGFLIRSAEFHFNPQAKLNYLPNLLEWVSPEARHSLVVWVQDQVNAMAAARQCVPALQQLKVLAPSRCMTAGTVSALELVMNDEACEEPEVLLRVQLSDWHG